MATKVEEKNSKELAMSLKKIQFKKRKKKLTALSKPFFESNTMTFAIIAGSWPCSLLSGNTVTSLTARALSLAEYAGITRKKLKWKRYDKNISDH